MRKPVTLLWVLVLFVLGGTAQQEKVEAPPAAPKVPPEEAERQNPVKATPDSIAEGKRIYRFDCAMCHGKDGDGKGDLAESLKGKLRDYRDPAALKEFKDGELFYIITKGRGEMPGEEDRMKPQACWNLVNYIRSLAKKESPLKSKEEKPE